MLAVLSMVPAVVVEWGGGGDVTVKAVPHSGWCCFGYSGCCVCGYFCCCGCSDDGGGVDNVDGVDL